ncbi:hypothetical protein PF672P1_00075 [Parabacteroides phage PF672P1]|nr:hypothetical protein PF672P1_00075 [Parabacteroides phage PF672P1]
MSNVIVLRSYQNDQINEVKQGFIQGYKRLVMQLMTGGGKTVCFSYIAKGASAKGTNTLILSNRTEILRQNGKTLQKFGLDVEYINPKVKTLPKRNMALAMSQTLYRRLGREEWKEYLKNVRLLIIDEAHECTSDFIFDYIHDDCAVIGVTATPVRYGKMKQLGLMYDAIVTGVKADQLIGEGWLCKAVHYSLDAPKLEAVKRDPANGDFNQKDLSKMFEKNELYAGVVENYQRLTPDTKAICFCVSSEQAVAITKDFNERGISAKYVLSNKQKEDAELSGIRDDVMNGFKNNEFKILVNVGIAVSGLDVPDIETVIANFATTSTSKWMQAIGRGSRRSKGKTHFNILDFGSNIERLGFFEDVHKWSLWHNESEGGGVAMTKECPTVDKDIKGKLGCGRLIHIGYKICPFCGYYFGSEKEVYEAHLVEVVKNTDYTGNISIEQYIAAKTIEGKNNNWILVQICIRNKGREKQAFYEAIKYMKSKSGTGISPKYWYFFKKNILKIKD